MIILLWLIHLDKRWFCNFHCPLIQSMWLFGTFYCIVLASLNLYSVYYHEVCPYALKHLLINAIILIILAALSYVIYQRTLFKKEQMLKYGNRQDIIQRLNNWAVRKVLLSKNGFAVFVFGVVQNIWAFKVFLNIQECSECTGMQPTILKLNLILTIMASIPIAFMIACYITVKFVGLITSSLFPNTYISIRKLFCK